MSGDLKEKFDYYLRVIDLFINKVLSRLMRFLMHFIVLLVAISFLVFELWSIFEYGEWFDDLSRTEFLFLVLFGLLLRRYIKRCNQFSVSVWERISRPLYWLGVLIIVELSLCGLFLLTAIYIDTGLLDEFRSSLFTTEKFDQMISFTTILVCMYLSSPTQAAIPLPKDKAQDVESPQPEPTLG